MREVKGVRRRTSVVTGSVEERFGAGSEGSGRKEKYTRRGTGMSGRSKNWLIVSLAVFCSLSVGLAASGSDYLTPNDYAVILTTLVENSDAINSSGPLPAESGARGLAILDRAQALDTVEPASQDLISTLRALGSCAGSMVPDDDHCGTPPWGRWPLPGPWPLFELESTPETVAKELVSEMRQYIKEGAGDVARGIAFAMAFESALFADSTPNAIPAAWQPYWKLVLDCTAGMIGGATTFVLALGEGWTIPDVTAMFTAWRMPLPKAAHFGGIALDPTAQWLYYVDPVKGTLNRADAKDPGSSYHQEVAAGLRSPGDVALDLMHGVAYVTESTSFPTVLGQAWVTRINLTDEAAFPISTMGADSGSGFRRIKMGMGSVGQIALDAAGENIYVVQWPSWIFCRLCLWGSDCESWCPLPDLVRLNLAAETKSVVTRLKRPSPGGIALTDDGAYAYVAGAHGALWRVDLATSNISEVGVVFPSVPVAGAGRLAWADASQTALYMAGNADATLWRADLSTTPATLTLVRDLYPEASLEGIALDVDQQKYVFVSGRQSIWYWSLTPSAPSGGYVFRGVGRVPVTSMLDGYANTIDLVGAPQFRNAAFGGTLDIFMTPGVQKSLYKAGNARYYRIMAQHDADPAVPLTSLFGGTWYDVTWDSDPFQRRYVSTPRIPVPRTLGGTTVYVYPLLSPSEVDDQYLPNLIMSWPTCTNGSWYLTLEVFSEAGGALTPIAIVGATNGLRLEIDNTPPEAKVWNLMQSPLANCDPVDTSGVTGCDIIQSGGNAFRFCIKAYDREGHLLSWSIDDIWGDNAVETIASDSYENHYTGGVLWHGLVDMPAPTGYVALDGPCCAHAIHLAVFGRTCNGWNYIHRVDYYMTFTLALNCP